MTYKGLIFDFFGVLCSEVAPPWLVRHFSEEEATAVKAEVVGPADRGLSSQGAMFAELAGITGIPAAQIEAEWLECARIDTQMVDVVRSLASSKRFSLGLLSNAPAPFLRTLLARDHLGSLFRDVVISSEEGCAKPDEHIYTLALARLGVDAEETLFIDDNPANVAGALAVGMDAIIFRSREALVADLRRMQLM